MQKSAKVRKKLILFTGGGTIGSVSPLLAIYDELNKEKCFNFLWIGTVNGVEKELVEIEGIQFLSIFSGKLRRYFSFKNFIDPFLTIIGFFQAFIILLKYRPDIILSAGGFVSVPVAFASFFLRVPIIIHQQDYRVGLANKIMAPLATTITTTFKKSLSDYNQKAIWIGNPLRKIFYDSLKLNKDSLLKEFNLKDNLPILLVLGGGTGASSINKFLEASLESLIKNFQIIHIAGKGKAISKNKENYYVYEFVDAKLMAKFYYLADMIISRCGMSALTELSFYNKKTILIPMPDSHQEDNARIFKDLYGFTILSEKNITEQDFANKIKMIFSEVHNLKNNQEKENLIKENAGVIMAELVKKKLF